MCAAQAVGAEWRHGQRHLADPAVPAELAAAVRAAGLIPLEPLRAPWTWVVPVPLVR